jgi:membrane fusion protein, multidrug efflux system
MQVAIDTKPLVNGEKKVANGHPKRTPPRRLIFAVVGAAAAIGLLIWGISWYSYAHVHESTDDAVMDTDPVEVTSKITERIDRILVDTNQPVKKGQLLVVLDGLVEHDQVNSAKAQYDLALHDQRTGTTQSVGGVTQAQGDLTNLAAQIPVAETAVVQAQAQLEAAKAQLPAAQASYDQAAASYRHTSSLVATGDLAGSELDSARAQAAAASAQLHNAEDQVSIAQANLIAAQKKVDAAQAAVAAAQGGVTTAQGKLAQSEDTSQAEAAKAQLAVAKQNLAYTRITSPIDGYVGEKNVEVGQTVQAGMTLMTLIPNGPNKIYVTANYKETQMKDMRVGQPVDIHVDAYSRTFHGHVVSINPASQSTYALVAAQNASGNFVKVTQRIPVRISIDDQDPNMPLRPGMNVETYVRVR